MRNQESLQSLVAQNGGVVVANAGSVTHEESLRPSPGGANCFNWVLGHICFWRNSMLQMASVEPVWDDGVGAQYRGSPGERKPVAFDPSRAFALERLVGDFDLMQQRLAAWASKPTRPEPPAHLLNLLLHESYHAGQLGILRRSLGKEGAI